MEAFFIAQICLFGGNFAPRGWAFCQGQLMAISQYDTLFALIGTTFGGDGVTTFAMPDFRGRIPVGTGHVQGLSEIVLGQKAGTASVTLTIAQMPAHTHTPTISIGVSTAAGDTNNPANTIISAAPSNFYTAAANANGSFAGSTVTVQPTGGSQPIDNMKPYLGINFVIALEGIFPSRN